MSTENVQSLEDVQALFRQQPVALCPVCRSQEEALLSADELEAKLPRATRVETLAAALAYQDDLLAEAQRRQAVLQKASHRAWTRERGLSHTRATLLNRLRRARKKEAQEAPE